MKFMKKLLNYEKYVVDVPFTPNNLTLEFEKY